MKATRRTVFLISGITFLSLVGYGGSPTAPNEQPMYGNQPKTVAQQEADKQFIEEVTKAAGSKEKAAGQMIQRGWEFISKGDLSTAMKRFNQAWLLTPDDMNVYWGFGAILGSQEKFNEAIGMFEKAQSLAPTNARLISDLGRTYAMQASRESSPEKKKIILEKSFETFERAASLTPGDANIYFQWALAYFYGENYESSWIMIHKAQAINKNAVDPRFLRDLSSKLPEPSTK
jgi:tetratricopeptide (TPR) repeat protein